MILIYGKKARACILFREQHTQRFQLRIKHVFVNVINHELRTLHLPTEHLRREHRIEQKLIHLDQNRVAYEGTQLDLPAPYAM